MLAKTWWCLIQNEDLLAHKVLAAKYWAGSSLRDALLANKCSFLWKSLMWGKEIIDYGAYWAIGAGDNVDVWKDKWVKGLPSFRIPWHRSYNPRPRLVSSFIDEHTKQWRLGELWEWFTPQEVDYILAIPISAYGGPDHFIWNYTSHGDYSVRSGYVTARVLRGKPVMDKVERSIYWQVLWKAQTAPKVQHFLWRLVHGILPTSNNLRARGLLNVPGCPVCSSPDESIDHVLFRCSFSVEVWQLVSSSSRLLAISQPFDATFWNFWLSELQKNDVLEVGMVLCWFLWRNRNQCLHDQRCDLTTVLARKVMQFQQNFNVAQVPLERGRDRSTSREEWQPPPAGFVKVNVDASVDISNRSAKLGFVIRDAAGLVLWCGVKRVAEIHSPLQAELSAILHGLHVVRAKRFSTVILESDCLVGVRAIRKGEVSFSPWHALIFDILTAKATMQTCRFNHVLREANIVAHDLAQFICFAGQAFIWESLPNQV